MHETTSNFKAYFGTKEEWKSTWKIFNFTAYLRTLKDPAR